MKKAMILLLVLGLALWAAGCGEKSQTVVEMGEGGRGDAQARPEDMTRPESMAGPEGTSPEDAGAEGMAGPEGTSPEGTGLEGSQTLTGRVEGIVGNEAALSLGEYASGAFVQSGESATCLLPVGMKIGDGDFSSVSAGMVLRITMDESDTILSVAILSR